MVAVGACVLALGAKARADDLHGTRTDQVRETAHQIRITLAPTHATLRVRRSVFNGGPRADQATFSIVLPPRAVATGLATLGSRDGRPFWFRGELLEAEEAARQYQELTGFGGHYPKDPALLSWMSQEDLLLQVFPCPAAANKWVEYTLEMPTDYTLGRYYVELPRLGTDALTASVAAWPEAPGDRLFVDGFAERPGAPIALNADKSVRIELESARPPLVRGELAQLELTRNRVLTHYRVAAAEQLSRAPKNARIVLVLDASHSLPADARLGAVSAARAYLSSFEDASVEIVAFDRQIHPRYGKLVPAARALSDLRALQLVPKNGSHVDRALAYADMLLAREPAGAVKRILLLTDALTRSTLTPDALRLAVENSHALVQVGVIRAGGVSVERDDEHPWAGFARSTGGLVWNTYVHAGASPSEAARVYDEWARPKALDHLRLTPASEGDGGNDTLSLREGEAKDLFAFLPETSHAATLRGELWTEPISLSFAPDEQAARRWAAFVFGSELESELSDEERLLLARHGNAVSPVTSLLAIEPGVRPSTDGFDREGIGGSLGSGIGLGGIGVLGHGAGISNTVDRRKYLEHALHQALAGCGGAERNADVELETTRAEIVDVIETKLAGTEDPKLEQCLREAVWALVLPDIFTEENARWALRL